MISIMLPRNKKKNHFIFVDIAKSNLNSNGISSNLSTKALSDESIRNWSKNRRQDTHLPERNSELQASSSRPCLAPRRIILRKLSFASGFQIMHQLFHYRVHVRAAEPISRFIKASYSVSTNKEYSVQMVGGISDTVLQQPLIRAQ
jgi:hypothetical protein